MYIPVSYSHLDTNTICHPLYYQPLITIPVYPTKNTNLTQIKSRMIQNSKERKERRKKKLKAEIFIPFLVKEEQFKS